MSIDVTNLKAASAGTIAMALDAKDGKSDGKISASIWNEFVADKGGKIIQHSINMDNAIKSISTYLARNAESMKENVNNLASNWLAKVVAPKENENKPMAADAIVKPEESETTEVVDQSKIENKTDVSDGTVKTEQPIFNPGEAFYKAHDYAKNKYGRADVVIRDIDKTVYVDVDGDGNRDIAFNNQGELIYDLLDTPTPPKGYAQKSVWYNPLTWF